MFHRRAAEGPGGLRDERGELIALIRIGDTHRRTTTTRPNCCSARRLRQRRGVDRGERQASAATSRSKSSSLVQ